MRYCDLCGNELRDDEGDICDTCLAYEDDNEDGEI